MDSMANRGEHQPPPERPPMRRLNYEQLPDNQNDSNKPVVGNRLSVNGLQLEYTAPTIDEKWCMLEFF